LTNFSSTEKEEDITFLFKTGVITGLLYGLPLNENIDIESGISFNRRGAIAEFPIKDNMGVPIGDVRLRTNYNYLSMPVNIRFHYGENLQIIFGLGAIPSYLIKSDMYFQDMHQVGDNDVYETTDERNRFDLSARAETGVLIEIHDNWSISARAGFQHSFLPFYEENYHRGTSFLTAVRFKL
jgi:hypothetical protein